MRTKYWAMAALIAALSGFLSSCLRPDDRARILELIDRIGSLIEDKNASGLMSLLNEDYQDFEHRNKKETEVMVKDYFHDYQGIVIHILGTRIDKIKEGEASLQSEVVVSSGAAKVFRKLFRAFGDFYRFDLRLRKVGEEWRIGYAKWENVGLSDLSPESLSALKKIFPGI
jgi:hypothetical protein